VAVAYVAYAFNFPDALAAAAAAGTIKGPVLLAASTLPLDPTTAAELARLKPAKIIVLGGSSLLSDAVEHALLAYQAG
jgi:putative cell wall-binding protein